MWFLKTWLRLVVMVAIVTCKSVNKALNYRQQELTAVSESVDSVTMYYADATSVLCCPALPIIPHADIITDGKTRELVYACADGYGRYGGDQVLRCEERAGVLIWAGEHIRCQSVVKLGKHP